MPADSPRIHELRRRVQADPSSVAFAQLGEELRRAGEFEEAVHVCRTGLTRHPAYLSARVTLGRALTELDQLDEARAELTIVVSHASDNLAAIRGLADIHRRRGELSQALGYYRRALELAPQDLDLGDTVGRMETEVARAAVPEPGLPGEAFFDFDRLAERLGANAPPGVAALDVLSEAWSGGQPTQSDRMPAPLAGGEDAFARLEVRLRQHQARLQVTNTTDPTFEDDEAAALGELEDWLEALRAPL